MRIHRSCSIALALGSLLASPLAFAHHADEQVNPQVVRISYLEGDVRVSRGTEGGAPKNVDWEQAVSGLPLETGFSIATGEGRAEIEFQDASTLFLAPNSVLIFNALATVNINSGKLNLRDVPHTELALLTGTATLNVEPTIVGETFILRTPTDTIDIPYGKKVGLRATSYMDAVALTPLEAGFIQLTKTPLVAPAARTLYYSSGKPVSYTAPASGFDFKEWDQWAITRIQQHDKATAAMLKQTGLKKPIPGLAQLAGQGRFVDCPGYGACWEPPAPAAQAATPAQPAPSSQLSLLPANSTPGSDAHPIVFTAVDTTSPTVALSGSPQQNSDGGLFPCGPGSPYYQYAMLSRMGYNGFGYMGLGYMGSGYGYMGGINSLQAGYLYAASPWAWAVCHSGSWLFQDNRYLWVPGGSIYNTPPVRWLQIGKNKFGYVPVHPRDVNGALPINRSHGVLTIGQKGTAPIQRVTLTSDKGARPLDTAPKGFRQPSSPTLARVGAPTMEAHVLHTTVAGDAGTKPANPGMHQSGLPGSSGAHATPTSIPITFDHQSQSFMMSHQVGASARTVSEPVGQYVAARTGNSFGGNQGAMRGPGGFNGGSNASLGGRGNGFNGGSGLGGGSGNPGFNPTSRGGGGGGGMQGGNGGGFHGGGGAAPTGGGGFHGGGGSMGGGGGMSGGGGSAPSGGSSSAGGGHASAH